MKKEKTALTGGQLAILWTALILTNIAFAVAAYGFVVPNMMMAQDNRVVLGGLAILWLVGPAQVFLAVVMGIKLGHQTLDSIEHALDEAEKE